MNKCQPDVIREYADLANTGADWPPAVCMKIRKASRMCDLNCVGGSFHNQVPQFKDDIFLVLAAVVNACFDLMIG